MKMIVDFLYIFCYNIYRIKEKCRIAASERIEAGVKESGICTAALNDSIATGYYDCINDVGEIMSVNNDSMHIIKHLTMLLEDAREENRQLREELHQVRGILWMKERQENKDVNCVAAEDISYPEGKRVGLKGN